MYTTVLSMAQLDLRLFYFVFFFFCILPQNYVVTNEDYFCVKMNMNDGTYALSRVSVSIL